MELRKGLAWMGLLRKFFGTFLMAETIYIIVLLLGYGWAEGFAASYFIAMLDIQLYPVRPVISWAGLPELPIPGFSYRIISVI